MSSSVICVSDDEVLVETTEEATVVETVAGSTIVSTSTPELILDISPATAEVVVTSTQATIVEVSGNSYPAPAPGEEEVVYTKRVDFITDNLFYKGESLPGTAGNTAAWRIRRVAIAEDGDVLEEWADGSADFAQVWDDRASLYYS